MSDDIGQEPQGVEEQQAPEVQDGNSQQQEQNPSNPFWADVERSLPASSYRTIKPFLDKADAEANRRISELNEGYKPWKTFAEQGYTPEQATQAFGVVRDLNNPAYQEQLYESLGNFLRENGRLPNNQELQQQANQDLQDPAGDEADPRDRQLQELMERQQRMEEFFQQQGQAEQQRQIEAEADTWAEREWSRVRQSNPGYGKDDYAMIGQLLAAQTNQGQEPNIDAAVASYNQLSQRLRTAPRASDSAPRIPGGVGGGGTPSSASDNGPMSKDDRIAAVMARVQRGN